jgi:hypothetical protein
VAQQQTIHHNLLPYFGISRNRWDGMARVWPPRLEAILEALHTRPPYALAVPREPEDRIVGACMLESHFLTGMLRYAGFPARVRAGYFRGIRADAAHVVRFWERVMREKRVQGELLERDPVAWAASVNAYTAHKNEIDHRIEHWICEYWDHQEKRWRLLDANTTFLEAHSDLRVGFHLPAQHFERAHEAWRRLRDHYVDPDQYAEEPQDGRSHIRSQLLWDFFSLLNHDIAGCDDEPGPAKAFVKQQAFSESPEEELEELDRLADLLAEDPPRERLVEFYRTCRTLRRARVEQDPYSVAI